tara:strand:- start:273 stop:812 length:540 start_codon:yes stop_codon:yes gene_type:complete
MASTLKVDNIIATDGTTAPITLSGDAATLGSAVTFPTDHIIQVVNATITNKLSSSTKVTSSTAVCDVRDQITITSGNAVLVHWAAFLYAVNNSNALIKASIRLGTTDSNSGTDLVVSKTGTTSGDAYTQTSLWAYDTSPGSTTPDYVMMVERLSGNTNGVYLNSHTTTDLYCYLFEVQQ